MYLYKNLQINQSNNIISFFFSVCEPAVYKPENIKEWNNLHYSNLYVDTKEGHKGRTHLDTKEVYTSPYQLSKQLKKKTNQDCFLNNRWHHEIFLIKGNLIFIFIFPLLPLMCPATLTKEASIFQKLFRRWKTCAVLKKFWTRIFFKVFGLFHIYIKKSDAPKWLFLYFIGCSYHLEPFRTLKPPGGVSGGPLGEGAPWQLS